MDGLLTEIRFALRHLVRSPSFSILVIVTLALGIGTTTAIFSVVNGVLLSELPYPESDRMIRVRTQFQGRVSRSHAAANFLDYREQIESIESVTTYRFERLYLGDSPDPQFVLSADCSHEVFDVAGIQPVMGRGFIPGDERDDADVVVISHGLWQSQFGGRQDVVGQKLTLDSRPYTVIGVMPAGFDFPSPDADVWRSLWFDTSAEGLRTDHLYSVIARIADGVPIEDAKAEFAAYGERIIREYPENYKDFQYGVSAVSLLEDRVGSVQTPLWILLAAVTLVLLIAIANVTNLMLVRAETRNMELSVRSALGASRPRIAWHLLTECLLLSSAGGAVGLVLSYLGTKSLLAFTADAVPRADNVGLDLRVLGVTAIVSIAAGILAGILPALKTPRRLAEQALGDGTRTVAAGGRSRLRQALVTAEVSLAMVLVVGSGLMIRTLAELSRVDVGFRTDDVLTTRVTLPSAIYAQGSEIVGFFAELEERIQALPGVVSAGIVRQIPLANGFGTYSIQIEGREVETIGESPHTYLQLTSPGYFRALGLAPTRGRLHDETDIAGRPFVAVVNEAFVREHLDGANPIGQRFRRWGDDTPWLEIVGVVPDIRQRDLEREIYPTMYVNHAQLAIDELPPDTYIIGFARSMGVVIHTERDAAALTAPVREIIREIGPSVPIGDFRTMADIRADGASDREFPTVLLVVFSGIALALAVVGVYGVVAYAASRRTFEMGIRMALGAEPSEIRQLVVRQALVPVIFGVLIGLLGAVFASKGLQSLLYNVGFADLRTLIVVPVIIVAAAVVASFVPAYRASRVDPSTVLRSE